MRCLNFHSVLTWRDTLGHVLDLLFYRHRYFDEFLACKFKSLVLYYVTDLVCGPSVDTMTALLQLSEKL